MRTPPAARQSWQPAETWSCFQSSATNLVRGDRNGQDDVFAFDRAAGTVTLVSAGTSTHPANGRSTPLAVSPNGRFVVFASTAGDLTSDAQPSPCPPGQECNVEIYLRDRAAGTTELVSRSAAGQPANLPSGAAAVSANGRYVAFASFATNLVAGDTNRAADVFLRDRVAGTTRRISTGPGGAQANGPSDTQIVSMTPDARFIAFSTTASNLAAHEQPGSWDVYMADRGTGTLRRVSGAGGRSLFPTISDNGRRVAFMTMAPLARGDRAGTWDIYVRSREGFTRIPLTTPSTARISGNGRYVAFPSNDPSLPGLPAGSTQAVVWDISAGRAIIASMAGESPAADRRPRSGSAPTGRRPVSTAAPPISSRSTATARPTSSSVSSSNRGNSLLTKDLLHFVRLDPLWV